MPKIEIVCLANSRKLQGRCLAGLRTDGQGWIRPVAAGSDGTLHPIHYNLQDGSEPRLLDLISVGFSRQQPEPHQPENWLIDSLPWQLIARPAPVAVLQNLNPPPVIGPGLFGNFGDRINYATFALAPSASSLAVVTPENLQWNIKTSYSGNRQIKANFTLSGAFYSLSVTDPVWVQRLDHLAHGLHPVAAAQLEAGQFLIFVLSLGEPASWDNCCYKLVAGVLLGNH